MSLAFARKLDFHIRKTNIGAQKIDGSTLEIFGMVITNLEVEDKAGRSRFFQETFLVADTKFEAILGISFLKIRNANVSFSKKTLTWKFYITNEALPTTKQVQIVDLKKFVMLALDVDSKTFVIYVAIRKQEKMPVHFKK